VGGKKKIPACRTKGSRGINRLGVPAVKRRLTRGMARPVKTVFLKGRKEKGAEHTGAERKGIKLINEKMTTPKGVRKIIIKGW